MRSKLLILAILLLSITLTGQALAATVTVTPSQVPKGAYVNGPNGATDDNFYWQAVKVTFKDTHVDIASFLTIDLPSGMTVADVNGAGGLADEVSLSFSTANDPVFTVTTVTASQIILDVTTAGPQDVAADDYVWVMFPVETQVNPTVAGDGYAITFGNPTVTDANITHANGAQITYRNAGALDLLPFTALLAGDNDSTSTYGQMYPATAAALFGVTPDLVEDAALIANVVDGDVAVMDADDVDVTYTLWAATDSTLSHVNVLTSGVTRAIMFSGAGAGGDFTVSEGATGSASEIATAALPEGNYYFYVTSNFTGDFPLSRSGQLHITHYPEVKVLGWDYDDNGTFDIAGNADDNTVYLDTGNYLGYTGVTTTTPRDNTDIYVNVDDYDDNAKVYLYYSTNIGLTSSNITTSGTAPDLVVTGLTGATVLVDTLFENKKDTEGYLMWNWSVSPIGSTYIPANDYTLYAVACDGKHTSIISSKGTNTANSEQICVKHSPSLTIGSLAEYDIPALGDVNIETSNFDTIMLTWGKSGIGGDSDIDDAAMIEFYAVRDADAAANYGGPSAATLRFDVNDLPTGVHRIVTGLAEDPENKADSYYAWNLKADYDATGWYPVEGDTYHIYAIIDENKTGGTARVVALGDDHSLAIGEAITNVVFTNATHARLYDPPIDGVTVYGDQTYRMRFSAFDFDADANLGIWVVKTTGTGFTAGPATTSVATINLAGAGNMYCLNSTTGDDAAIAALKSRTDTSYDLTVRLPSEALSRYTTDNNAGPGVMTAGTYWVYIGNPLGTLYRAPGTITFKNIANANVPSQKNLMLTPSVFTVSLGDTMTFAVRAADQGNAIDLIDAYIAVEKTYFNIVAPTAPFTDGAGAGAPIANEVFDDAANNRWILHTTILSGGNQLNPLTDTNLGDVEATFRLVSTGTTNAIGASSSIYFVNEPANEWVTKFSNDGSTVSINVQQNTALIQPRGIIEGIMEFQGRDTNLNYTVTFDLRQRGSYVNITDSTMYAQNDADPATPGMQYTLDNDGKFTLYKIPSGTYDFVVMYDRYLAKKQEIKVEAGLDTLFVSFDQLLGGDCFGYTDSLGAVWPNNRIDDADVSRISDAYLATSAHAKWNDGLFNYKWADIDESGAVGIIDLQMATSNYTGANNDGAHPVWAKPTAGDNTSAIVALNGVPGTLVAGQSYTVQVAISNAAAVRGYYVNLGYDKDALAIDGIVKGGFITESSCSFPVSGDGTIGFANAVYGSSVFSGSGVLAEVTFTAKKSGAFTADMLSLVEITVVNGEMLSENIVSKPTFVENNTPSTFALSQNFPNPFNPTTTISFSVPQASDVTLKIYDVLGRNVRTLAAGSYTPGTYTMVWDARDARGSMVSAGTYFYSITAGNYHESKRMLFLK